MVGKRRQNDRKGVEIDEGSLEGVGPWLHRSIEDSPWLQHVMAFKANAGEFADCTVQAIATHYPAGLHLVALTIALDIRENAIAGSDGQPGQAGGSMHQPTVLLEVAREDGLCDLFGEADIEAVDAAAAGEIDRPEELAAGMDFDDALPASGSEKLFHQAQSLEDLQRARMNDGRSIPVERRRLGIDQVTGHSSAAQLGGEEQPGGAGSNDEHNGLTACLLTHRRRGFQKIWGQVGVVNPVTFFERKRSGMLVEDRREDMASMETQIWKSARLTIERGENDTLGTVFRFTGPFTGRDMYNSLSPDAFRSIFEPARGDAKAPAHVFDLTEVPYMDSTALGMLVSHHVRCQSKGIRLSITGVNPRIHELFRLTGMTTVLPVV